MGSSSRAYGATRTIIDRLSALAAEDPQHAALLAPGRSTLHRRELWAHLMRVREQLAAVGVDSRATVAVALQPGPEMATAALATMTLATVVPLDPGARADELRADLLRATPALLVIAAHDRGALAALAAELQIPLATAHWDATAAAGCFTLAMPSRQVAGRSALSGAARIALILQTSGTTSRPKRVPLTEDNLLAAADALIASLALVSSDRCLTFMPQHHIGGIWDTIAGPLLSGGAMICGGRFSAAAFLDAVRQCHPTWTQLAPAMLRSAVDALADTPCDDLRALRFVRSVSAPLPRALQLDCEQRWRVPVIEIYGMTEAAGVIASNPLPPASRPSGSVGRIVGPHVTIVGADGVPAPCGAIGEVVLAGASVAAGYLDAGEADGAAFRDGRFYTGDLGRRDAGGFLFLTGRTKDLINRGGEKIAPQEIDEVMLAVPWITDAASFAVPHPDLGEEVAAAIVLSADAPADAEAALHTALRERLSYFKWPAQIHRMAALPRTGGGKLQRAALAQMVAARDTGSAPDLAAPSRAVSEMGPIGDRIAEIWATALDTAYVGPDDDFFALGGNSLRAAFAVTALERRCPGQIVYVSSIFDAPTPARYEAFLREHHPEVASLLLGEVVRRPGSTEPGVTAALRAQFVACIAPTRAPVARGTSARVRNPRAVFILSPPRSGSTLLRAMLAGHPSLFAPPELYLLSHDTLATRRAWFRGAHASQLDGLQRAVMQACHVSVAESAARLAAQEARDGSTRAMYGALQRWIGARVLVDKTPFNAVDENVLARIEDEFDAPLYVHLSRHPYGMIRSFEEARMRQLWWPRLVGPNATPAQRRCPFSARQLGELLWTHIHATIRTALRSIPAARQLHLRFEDVVAAPAPAMARVCELIGIPTSDAMLRPLDDARERMTDGVHPTSRMIGDPKFHSHTAIDAGVAAQWQLHYERDFLDRETWALAAALGHHETLAATSTRVEIEI